MAMTASDKLFTGSIPEIYDRHMVPMLFAPYAADLAQRLAVYRPHTVLETAAGTGVVTRALAARLGTDTSIIATDLNQPMLDRARTAGTVPERIVLQQADAQALPFADGSFDAVVCQFGAMFFPDRVKAYREALRVLKPGGRFLFNVWDRLDANPVSQIVSDAVAAAFPEAPSTFMERVPHGYHDVEKIQRELMDAGFASVTTDTVDLISRAGSARDAAMALCQGTPMRSEIVARDPARLEEVTEAAEAALAQRLGSGAIEAPMRAYVMEAVRGA
jgi:ubiquinone/menaquinone biosynthesis C-methylase UbiE